MKSITWKTLTAILLLIIATACGSKKQEDSVEVAKDANEAVLEDRDDEKDADFIVNTIAANYGEIKLAQLAQNRSNDAGVKELAKMLETDHTRLISELKTYADKNGIMVPAEESEADKKDYNDLTEVQDVNDFDEKWCEMMKDKHEKSINKFEKRLNRSEDPELKNWVNATLPALRAHLEQLKQNKERLQ